MDFRLELPKSVKLLAFADDVAFDIVAKLLADIHHDFDIIDTKKEKFSIPDYIPPSHM